MIGFGGLCLGWGSWEEGVIADLFACVGICCLGGAFLLAVRRYSTVSHFSPPFSYMLEVHVE